MCYTKMVEVFKTNVTAAIEAAKLVALLQGYFPGSKISFDLEDCDRVLRVEGRIIFSEKVIHLLQSADYECDLLNC